MAITGVSRGLNRGYSEISAPHPGALYQRGYQKLDLKGDGKRAAASGAITNLWEMDKPRQEWPIGGGLSIKF